MVRLMLTLTPAVCILGGIAFSKIFENHLKEETPVISNGTTKLIEEKQPVKDKTPSKSQVSILCKHIYVNTYLYIISISKLMDVFIFSHHQVLVPERAKKNHQ